MIVEMAETVGEHFGGAVQALVERLGAPHSIDNVAKFIQYTHLGKHCLVTLVMLLPENTAIGNGVPQGAYADLQGAAIGQEAAGVQSNHVVRGFHGRGGGAEQRMVVFGVVEDEVISLLGHNRIVVHERQLRVYLSYDCNLFALVPQCL